MKITSDGNIQTQIAENMQDIQQLFNDFMFLSKTGCLKSVKITRNVETMDYIDTFIEYNPEQNWIL